MNRLISGDPGYDARFRDLASFFGRIILSKWIDFEWPKSEASFGDLAGLLCFQNVVISSDLGSEDRFCDQAGRGRRLSGGVRDSPTFSHCYFGAPMAHVGPFRRTFFRLVGDVGFATFFLEGFWNPKGIRNR